MNPVEYREAVMGRREEIAGLVEDVGATLRYQQELGLSGLEGSSELFVRGWSQFEEAGRGGVGVLKENSDESPGSVAEPSGRPTSVCLTDIVEEIGDCQRCKLSRGRTNIVFGVGNENARLMFVGEGPGRDEDLQGEPFVGKAGQLLTKMIEAGMGLRRSDVYIANIVKCRPPRNRDPEPDEVEACEPFLKKQIQVIRPEVIVALGRYAAQTLLQDRTPVSRMRGKWREYEGIPVMPTYHPAYLLRNPAEKRPVWMDIQEVMKRLGLERPSPKQ